MLYQPVNRNQFILGIKGARPDKFSHYGIEALYEYHERLSDFAGEPVMFNAFDICNSFAEYDFLFEVRKDYPELPIDEEAAHQWLNDNKVWMRVERTGGYVVHRPFV
jgi:hypothetical protein